MFKGINDGRWSKDEVQDMKVAKWDIDIQYLKYLKHLTSERKGSKVWDEYYIVH
jgi:hypothetical protein